MKKFIPAAIAVLVGLQFTTSVRAQSSGTEAEIIFTQQTKEESRQQLRRLSL